MGVKENCRLGLWAIGQSLGFGKGALVGVGANWLGDPGKTQLLDFCGGGEPPGWAQGEMGAGGFRAGFSPARGGFFFLGDPWGNPPPRVANVEAWAQPFFVCSLLFFFPSFPLFAVFGLVVFLGRKRKKEERAGQAKGGGGGGG